MSTNRRDLPIFLTAEWRHLAMINYAVDPAILRPYVPAGTELDSWNGTTYVSMVGFLFLQTRLLGAPIPFHRNFEEVNLRFYVRRRTQGEVRRGVVFLKEIVPRAAIAAVARLVYNENYVALPMQHHVEYREGAPRAVDEVHYGWRFENEWQLLAVKTEGPARHPAPGSEAAFITEHYWGYAAQRDGSTVEYRVEHPPWEVWEGATSAFLCDVAGLYGPAFVPYLGARPTSAFVARGSEVVVRRGRQLNAR